MQIITIIDCIQATHYLLQEFTDGEAALDRVLRASEQIAPAAAAVILAKESTSLLDALRAKTAQHRHINIIAHDNWTMEQYLETLQKLGQLSSTDGAGQDILFVVFQGDAPLVDLELAEQLIELYKKYHPDYVFADGYPEGFSPEVITAQVIPELIALAKQHAIPYSRNGLFAVIQKDINAFDIETMLAPIDMRPYRCVPLCNNKRNFLTVQQLWQAGIQNAQVCAGRLPHEEALLRTVPAFYAIQITEGCPQACTYCPYPLMQGDPRDKSGYMSVERFREILNQISAFSEDAVIDISLWGEPSLHPDIRAIVAAVLEKPELTLIIETSGIGWQEDTLSAILDMAEKVPDTRQYAPFEGPRLHVIVSLDAWNNETYNKLRGTGFERALAFTQRLLSVYPQGTHIQAVRMQENEEELEEFHSSWKKITEHIIIQKYELFTGSLPDRRVTDITPVRRMACRHIARDMSILLDGSVPVCKYALQGKPLEYCELAGNILKDGIAAVWTAMGELYKRHCNNDYPDFCRSCDEYYTFNA